MAVPPNPPRPPNPPSSPEPSALGSTMPVGSGSADGSQIHPALLEFLGNLGAKAADAAQSVERLNQTVGQLGEGSGQGRSGQASSTSWTNAGPWTIDGEPGSSSSKKKKRQKDGELHDSSEVDTSWDNGGHGRGRGGGRGGGQEPAGGDSGMYFGAGGFRRVATFYAASSAIQGLAGEYRTNADYARALRQQTTGLASAAGPGTTPADVARNRIGIAQNAEDAVTGFATGRQMFGASDTGWGMQDYFARSLGGSAEAGALAAGGLMQPQAMQRMHAMGIVRNRRDMQNPEEMVERIIARAGGGVDVRMRDIDSEYGSTFRANVRQIVGAENEQAVLEAARANRGHGQLDDEQLEEGVSQAERAWERLLRDEDSLLDADNLQRRMTEGFKDVMGTGQIMPWMGALSESLGQAFMSLLPYMMGSGIASQAIGKLGGAAKGAGGAGGFFASGPGRLLRGAGILGAGTLAVDGLASATGVDEAADEGSIAAGAGYGALGGAAFGAGVGSVIPGVGTAIGGGVGAVVGGVGGGLRAHNADPEGDPPGRGGSLAGVQNPLSAGEGGRDLNIRTGGRAATDSSHIEGLHPQFRARLAEMMAQNPELYVYSGKRSSEHQKMLWERKLRETGGNVAEARKWVAPPKGTRMPDGSIAKGSNHERGLAADVGPDSEHSWLASNVARHGLEIPLSHEPWHVEPKGLRSGGEEAWMEQEASPSANASSGVSYGGDKAPAGAVGAGSTRIQIQGDEAEHVKSLLAGAGDVGPSSAGGAIADAMGTGDADGGTGGQTGPDGPGGPGGQATGDLAAFKAAIRALESGGGDPAGNYSAEGPLITNPGSMYHGERAYGAYQIMPGNWDAWAAEAGIPGASIEDPAAQDRVAAHKLQGYKDQYGSWEAAAVAWFAGPANAAKFVEGQDLSGVNDSQAGFGGTSVPGYVSTIQDYMREFSEGDPPDGSGRPRMNSGDGGGGTIVTSGAKTVNLNVYPANASDADAIARRVLKILRSDEDFEVVGSM